MGVLLLAVSLVACQVGDLDLQGKACPCASGWVCEPRTNLCVQGGLPDAGAAGRDAGSDAAVDAGCEFIPGSSPGLEGPRGWPSCSNGVDDDCDGFTDEDDGDCSYQYSVVTAVSSPVIDGRCDEYYGAQSLQLRADEDNAIAYWVMWDMTGLYVCAEVTDGSLDASNADPVLDRDGDLWRDDSLELYFDVDHDAGPTLQTGDYKFFVNAANVQADREGTDSDWNVDFESAVQLDGTLNADGDVDRGFSAELSLPWDLWGVAAPVAQDVWGGEFMWDDRDDFATPDRRYEIWSHTIPGDANNPDAFGDLLFLE
jgi:hypothetical protein